MAHGYIGLQRRARWFMPAAREPILRVFHGIGTGHAKPAPLKRKTGEGKYPMPSLKRPLRPPHSGMRSHVSPFVLPLFNALSGPVHNPARGRFTRTPQAPGVAIATRLAEERAARELIIANEQADFIHSIAQELPHHDAVIGQGSFGSVSLCFDQHHGTLVAIAVKRGRENCAVHNHYLRNEEKLLALAQAAGVPVTALTHLPQRLADGAQNHLAMQCATGGTLDFWIKYDMDKTGAKYREWRMIHTEAPTDDDFRSFRVAISNDKRELFAAGVAPKLVLAFAKLHAAGIAHGDIKPENILMRGQEPLIADFGLATQNQETAVSTGTANYMAPEAIYLIIHGCGVYNTLKADVYALGVVLYQTFTGVLPHGDLAPYKWATRVRRKTEEAIDYSSLPGGTDGAVAGNLRQMLQPDPNIRVTMASAALFSWR